MCKMTYQEFVNIVVKECVEFANYLDYLPLYDFTEDEIMDSLKSSHNEQAKEALRFYRKLSVQKAEVLMMKVYKKLESYYDDDEEEAKYDKLVGKKSIPTNEDNTMNNTMNNRFDKQYDDFLYSGYGQTMSFDQYKCEIVGLPQTRYANNNDYDTWAGSGLGSSMSFNEYCRRNGLVG